MPTARRAFGTVRQLPSGRWQARYRGPDGVRHSAPHSFSRKRDANLYLAEVQGQVARGDWIDPDAGQVSLSVYGRRWLADHTGLADTTAERYESAFRLKILPRLGDLAIGEIREPTVRRWHRAVLDDGNGWPSVAKAYRLLRAILNTAVEDGLIRRNPCRIKGAGDDRSPERQVLTVAEVHRVVDAMQERYRLLVLLATFTSLRLGELAALRRQDLDLDDGWVRVVHGQVELSTGKLIIKGPKSEAGRRRVGIPSELLPALRWHISKFAEPGPSGRVFVGPYGGYLRRQNFRRIWVRALSKADVAPVHFHDLRHTGNTLAASSGANLRELMERMGHASSRAALIYLHAANDRDRAIADSMNVHLAGALRLPSDRAEDA